jgi:hypothetical protein
MGSLKILLFSLGIYTTMTDCMQDVKIDIKPDQKLTQLKDSQEHMGNLACQCKLCKGIKIAVASNVVSIAATAAVTMLINYNSCSK